MKTVFPVSNVQEEPEAAGVETEDTKRKVQLQIFPDSETGFPHPLQLHKI